jgi:hypothetical protein
MLLEVFKHLLEKIESNNKTVDEFYQKLDLTNITDDYNQVITILFKCYYGDEAEDWISWFLYERDEEKGLLAWQDGKEICRNVEELWEICEELKKTKTEYSIPQPMSDEERIKMLETIFK